MASALPVASTAAPGTTMATGKGSPRDDGILLRADSASCMHQYVRDLADNRGVVFS
jgi:hypothetical protein